MKGSFHIKMLILVFSIIVSVIVVHGQGTIVGFYLTTCPQAESIVSSTVQSYLNSDISLAAGLLKMHFSDCFVRGCDASILIVGADTESTGVPNLGLKGYEVIDNAKAKLEAVCPGVVSCADILALAARDSVVLSGGLSWVVPTGRRDGRVSLASEVGNLPGPFDSVDVQKQKFASKGLATQDLVILSGGHTIGTTSCNLIINRLYNFDGNGGADPSIDPSFLPQLQALCPQNSDGSTRVALDFGSQTQFDPSYFQNLMKGQGILQSDQALWSDASTKPLVQGYSRTISLFNLDFAKSMVKMSNIEVLTGVQGEIRKICFAIN